MKLNNIKEVDNFIETIKQCEAKVWLESAEGDKINLKSQLSQYIALGALLKHETDLELFCSNSKDEALFYRFFNKHPKTL